MVPYDNYNKETPKILLVLIEASILFCGCRVLYSESHAARAWGVGFGCEGSFDPSNHKPR